MTDREAIEYLDQVLKYADEFLHAGDYNAKTLKEIEVIKQALSALKEREERSKGVRVLRAKTKVGYQFLPHVRQPGCTY